MSYKALLFGALIVFLLTAAACSGDTGGAGEGDPAAAVRAYLQAKVTADREGLSRLLCSEMEGDLEREAMSFDSVEARLGDDVVCTADAGGATVSCTGNIVAVYGGEDTLFPLGTYRVVQEAGEWKWCGEAGR